MPVRVQGPDGNTYSMPDGTDRNAAIAYFKRNMIGTEGQKMQPTAPTSVPVHTPVSDAADSALTSVGNFGKGLYQSALNVGANADKLTSKIPVLGKYLTQPISTTLGMGGPTSQQYMADEQARSVPQNTTQKVGKVVGDTAQFLIPGAGEEAVAGKLGGGLLARAAAKAASSAVVNRSQGGSAAAGALMGASGEGIASSLRAVAPHIAEAALNVAGRDRMYGRTVGEAILNDTNGVRPATIQASAQGKIAQLAPQVEQVAADAGANGARGSLLSSRNIVGGTQAVHTMNRAVDSAAELSPLANRLQTDAVTKLPLAESQTPTGLLAMKRGINSDFITRWKPENQGLTKEAQKVYGTLADEFHSAAPGTAELDQRMSSLFPVVDRAGAASAGASIAQNVLHKFKTPTGALAGAFAGGTAGYEQTHSLPGAMAGAALGAVAPAVVANPATQMLVARTLYSPALGRFVFPGVAGLGLQVGRGDGK